MKFATKEGFSNDLQLCSDITVFFFFVAKIYFSPAIRKWNEKGKLGSNEFVEP